MSFNTKYLYQFGGFTLDAEEMVLQRDGKPLAITPKALEMLCVLIKDHGRIVEKEQLMNEVWADSFVEESNITFTIRQLRKILGDNAQNPVYIETVPKRGYRFIADVSRIETENAETAKENNFSGSSLGDNPAPPAKFPQPVKSGGGMPRPGAIVALADWRHAADKNPAETVKSGTSNGQIPTTELISATPVVKNFRIFYLIVLAGLICLVAAAGIGYGLYSLINFSGGEKPAVSSAPNMTRLTSNGNAKFASVAPDGKFIAYVVEENKRQSLLLKNTANGSTIQILPHAEQVSITSVTFSPDGNHIYYSTKPDGNHIYYSTNKTLYQLPVLGGTAKKVLQNFHGGLQLNQISFSPDGSQFTFVRHTSGETSDIIITNADGTNERILVSSKRPFIFLRSAAWSPDGKSIACAVLNSAGFQQVVLVNISDAAISAVRSPDWTFIKQFVWRPDGSGFLIIAGDDTNLLTPIWSLSYPSGEARNITNDTNDYQTISLTADASSVVAVRAEQEAHIWVTSAEDVSRIKQLTSGFEKFDGVLGINWTTDGKIIFEAYPSGKPEIWKIDADGSNLSQIAGEAGAMSASPDGKTLIYQSIDDGRVGLFRLNLIDGEKKRLTNGTDIDPAFSPDGRWIVFTRYAEDVALWKVPVDGSSEAVKLTKFSGSAMFPSISPDGRFIAFYRGSAESQPPVSIISIDGGEIVKAFNGSLRQPPGNGKAALHWTADGQALDYVIHSQEGVSNIWRQKLDGSPPIQLTSFTSGSIFNFTVSPDGKQFALSRGTFSRDVILIKNLK